MVLRLLDVGLHRGRCVYLLLANGAVTYVGKSITGFRDRFEVMAAQHEADLRDQLQSAGVDVLELATDEDLLGALLRYVALRRQRGRAVSGHRMPAALRTPAAA